MFVTWARQRRKEHGAAAGEGGIVVRITSTGGEVTYVPLRGLRYSGAKPAAVANPEVTGVEWVLRSGLGAVGVGTTLWLGVVILKGG